MLALAPGHGAVPGHPATHEIDWPGGRAKPGRQARQGATMAADGRPRRRRVSAAGLPPAADQVAGSPAAGRLAAPDPRPAGGAAVDAILEPYEVRPGAGDRRGRAMDRPDDGKSVD